MSVRSPINMAILHIIQKNEDVIESIVTDISFICEISFQYPTEDIKEDEVNDNKKGIVEISYVNGGCKVIDTAAPTVFRIVEGDELIVKTSHTQQFEQAYLGFLAEAFAGDGGNGFLN